MAMSDSGQDDSKPRRRRNEDYDSRARGNDRSSHRSSNRYRDRDDDRESYRRERRPERERNHGDHSRERRRSRSPPSKRRRSSHSASPPPTHHNRARGPLPSQNDSFQQNQVSNPSADPPPPEKEKPNYKPTGLLAKEANTIAGTTTVLKYHEPPEARKPPAAHAWRLYVFAGKDLQDTIHLPSRSAWLFGRDERVADYVLNERGCSKQHAVVQFRYVSQTDEFGEKKGRVRPYLIDLESKAGTRLNGKVVEGGRYVELRDGDVIVFGEDKEREFVVMLPPVEKEKK